MRILIATCCALALTSCSTIYRSPDVVAGVSGGTNVRVVPLTGETVVQANQSPYSPKTLPAIFSITAGSGAGRVPRGAGTLPEPPSTQDSRPGDLTLRVPPAADPRPYKIGVGDVVVLATPATNNTVEQLTGLLAAQNARQGYTVQDDGSVNIPNVGRVRIAMMTVDEAEAELFQRLVENQIDPTFSLEVSEFNSRRVSVGGAVGKPTVLPITLTPLFLDEALSAAGGVGVEDMDYASVRIYRDGNLYQIPLNDLYSSKGLQRTRLIEGDSVFVDTDYKLDRAEAYFGQQIALVNTRMLGRERALNELAVEIALRRSDLGEARGNYDARMELGAVDQDYVYLFGEVSKQSRFVMPFERQATLADALFDEGSGIAKETGDVSEVYVLRASNDPREFGAVTAWHLDARNAANIVLATRFELRPNDIVFIAENPVTKWGRTIKQITPSLLTTAAVAAGN